MATSKKKKVPSVIEDIEHEHVPAERAPAVTQPQEAEVVAADEDPAKTLELTIAREIKKFGIADAGIEELKKKYGELTIVDTNDKAGYDTVKKAWGEVRTVRTALEKKGLDIRNTYNKITKAVKGEEDRLIALVKPLEEDLQKKYRKVDEELEAEKQRKLKEEEDRLNGRIDELLAAGVNFKDGYYGIGGTIAIDVASLRAMDEFQYRKLMVAVENKAAEIKAEEARLAEEKRLADEKFAADQQKLKDEQDKLDREKAQLDEDRKEVARMKLESRLDRLQGVGLTLSVPGDRVVYDNGYGNHTLMIEDIMAADAAAFEALVATARTNVTEYKRKQEQHEEELAKERKALAEKKDRASHLMADAGMTYLYQTETFTFKNDIADLKHPMEKLVQLDDEELQGLAAELADVIREAKKEQAALDHANKQAAEKLRRSMLGDSVNFAEYINELLKVPMPEMKSEVYQAKINSFFTRLDALAKEYMPEEEAVQS
jgi:hypothetical protein